MTETLKKIRHREPKVIRTPNEIISREDAKMQGRTQFFVAEPCMRGHISTRNVANGGCLECVRVRLKEKYAANPEKYRRLTVEYQIRMESRDDVIEPSYLTCTCCDKTLPANDFYKNKFRKSGRTAHCIVCQADKWRKYQTGPKYGKCIEVAKARKRRMKLENPKHEWAKMVRQAMSQRSRKRGDQSTDIDLDWILENAPTHCPLLGTELNYGNGGTVSANSAVIDRIDNNIGYRQSNCWVISMKANRIKTNATLPEIEMLAANFRAYVDSTARDLV